ncbi:MAG: transketolase [Bacteroidetes bacterium]|nr:transketolase [Bacteroidota bacterium]
MNKIDNKEIKQFQLKAIDLRMAVVDMISKSDICSGHFGGSLSPAEIMAVLYFHEINIDPSNPKWELRDRFVLSKGHAVPVLYAALAERGYFSKSILRSYREKDSILQGHPDCQKTPGLDTSSGSLGQGLSIGLGMALAAPKNNQYKVYVLLSDGEMQEGMVWEAAMAAAHHKASNLIALVDCNDLQVDGKISDIMNIEPLSDKWKAFGWDVQLVNGHNVTELLEAFAVAKNSIKPVVIICKTVKGKGVSFMENNIDWHCTAITPELHDQAIKELENAKKAIEIGY